MSRKDKAALEKILSKGRELMLQNGYNGTGIEDICKAAGVTKGAVFHYFSNKENLAVALLEYHWDVTQAMLSQTPYFKEEDPLNRILLYVELFIAMGKIRGAPMSCLFGNLTQELANTDNVVIRKCGEGFHKWIELIRIDLENARIKYQTSGDWSSTEVAEYFVSLYEGSLILVKARKDPEALSRNMTHFKNYLQSLFVFVNQKPKRRRSK